MHIIAAVATLGLSTMSLAACTSPDGKAAPYGAMFSAEEALKTLFDDVCAPAILEGKSVETLARGRSMIEVDSQGVNAGALDREWRLASLGDASVTAWADGTCMVSLEQGDSEKHRDHMLGALAAKGVKLTKGTTIAAANGGANTAYCTAENRPLVLGVISRTPGSTRRTAIVANLFRAKTDRPAFCATS